MPSERRRPAPESPPGERPGLVATERVELPPLPEPPAGAGAVQVIWGPTAESLELAGLTVDGAYQLLRAPFHIAPGVRVLVNGEPAAPDQRLAAGDLLEFTRPAGEKGA